MNDKNHTSSQDQNEEIVKDEQNKELTEVVKKEEIVDEKPQKVETSVEESEIVDAVAEEKNQVVNEQPEEIATQEEDAIEMVGQINEEVIQEQGDRSSEEIKEEKEIRVAVAEEDTIKKKKRKIIIITIAIIIALIAIFLGGIVCLNKMNANVYKNVSMLGIDFSGQNEEEIKATLNQFIKDHLVAKEENQEESSKQQEKLDIYQGQESIYSILPSDFDFSIDLEKSIRKIMGFGRDSNLFQNNINIIKAYFSKVDIQPEYQYNEEKIESILKNIDLTVKDRFVDDKYSVDEEHKKLVITRGTKGNALDYDTEKQKIVEKYKSMITNMNGDESPIITLDLIQKQPSELNLDQVYTEVKRDPKDAYIDKESNPVKLVSEIVGLDFKVEELKNLLEKDENKEDGKVIEFGLTVIEPKVKLADISYMLYKDKIAGLTTYFDASQANRANNLAIALRDLNGKIIMPGETFSYNKAIGDTTVAKGYKPAATFKGGTVVDELGGGICQTTSTLYDVALMANLQIVERHQHGLPVGYVPPSLDATVYSPVLDFKFKNTRKYPVKIVTSFSNAGSMNISIFGTKEETEYDISLSHKYMSTIAFSTKYVYDDTLPEGQQVVVSKGVNGYTSEGYITKKLNGKVVSSSLLSKDTYNAQAQIIKIGTKK